MAEGKSVPPATLEVSEVPVLHIMVVGFHHQKGSTVEYVYPPFTSFTTASESLTTSLPVQWKPLPHIALPDGCHNYQEGNVTFTLLSPTSDKCLFGVSSYRQIDSKEFLDTDSDITRSTIQKSICVLSQWPVSSFIEAKVKLATHAYFNSKDFNDTTILVELYEDLNNTLTINHSLSICLQGYNLTDTVSELSHKLLQLFKTVLLQKRILIHGSNPGRVSSIVMAIVSLMPLLLQSLINSKTTDEMGFPLTLFPTATCIQPYVSIQQMDVFTNMKSLPILAGAVNPLYIKQQDKLVDVMYNIDNNQLTINNSDLRIPLNLTSPDLRFCDSLKNTAVTERDNSSENKSNPIAWTGGEDWLREQFRLYLLALLATTVNGDSIAYDDYNSDFIQMFTKTEAYSKWMASSHQGIERVSPKHLCEGELSLNDIKRQLTVRAEEYGLDKVVTPTQVEQVG